MKICIGCDHGGFNLKEKVVEHLKEKGYWIVGAEYCDRSVLYTDVKYDMPVCLVIGNEGKGISKIIKDNCDFMATIPMSGNINSLNASVAAGIMIYEVIRSRR